MEKRELIYHFLTLIPKGKVITYKEISRFFSLGSPRLVGQILHLNRRKTIPCFKVVFADGGLAEKYAFGGKEKQKKLLEKVGVFFLSEKNQTKNYQLDHGRCNIGKGEKVDLKKSLWRPTKLLKLYFQLLEKFGFPGPWPWFNQGKPATKEEIAIGAFLAQNTNWRNVEKAMKNLRLKGKNTLLRIYGLGKDNLENLKNLIRPAGFYNQKAERLYNFAKFINENYQNLANFFLLPKEKARKKLLSLKGIGEETADTLLLYAGEKPVFVIDNYTKKFLQEHFFSLSAFFPPTKKETYSLLQKFFLDNLPENVSLFQNYHALIVQWGKTRLRP